jgi:hypothetical protein
MTGVFGAAFWLAVLLLRPGDTALAQPVPRAEGGHDGPAVLALGFEDYTGPQLPPLFSLSADAPRTGKACLRWKNDDPKVYQFPTFPVPLKAGRMYDIEAWVRPRGVTPGRNQGGAGLGVEWLNAEGAWGGGDYPEGWVGTTEGWQRLRYRVRIPADMQTPKLVLYARPECTGEAFWDDVTIRAVPMTIEPISSATGDLREPACWPRDKRLTARLPRLGVALLTLAFL